MLVSCWQWGFEMASPAGGRGWGAWESMSIREWRGGNPYWEELGLGATWRNEEFSSQVAENGPLPLLMSHIFQKYSYSLRQRAREQGRPLG